MDMKREHLVNLAYAKGLLEKPSLAARVTNVVGTPIEKGFAMLPDRWSDAVQEATRVALQRALEAALATMDDRPRVLSMDAVHKGIVATTGAVGGAFGLGALAIELPISTTVILRSIAAIAAAEGENPRHLETKLDCLQVFAFGSPSTRSDDAAESGYFATRVALANAMSDAATYLAKKGLTKASAPALVRLVSLIGSRFGIVVSEKAAAQMVPIIGAAGGATINALFIEHYQQMATGHFIVRRLEKIHGAEPVRLAYERI